MNWRLLLKLSLFGLAMAIATVYWIHMDVEPFLWLVIFVVSAIAIAKQAPGRLFLHGVVLGLLNCVWIVLFHVALAPAYLANHPQETEMMSRMPLPTHPRVMMAIVGPVVGLISGIVIGLLSLAAALIVRNKQPSR